MYNDSMITLPSSLRIGVIRGGVSPEYESSLKSGANVLKDLSETHKLLDIFISQDGIWHMQGMEKSPERILKNVDVIFNALHGTYGDNGGVQENLKFYGIPFTGSDKFSSAIATNRWIVKEQAKALGIKTPAYGVVRRSDDLARKAQEIFNSIPHPLRVSPANGPSSMGVFEVNSFKSLLEALENVLERYDMALVEESISGKTVSCLVTENFRGEDIYAFPPSSILSTGEKNTVEEFSKKIHQPLGLSHYSNSDFIISPRRGTYFLEVDASPKLHKDSFVIKSLESVGSSTKEFIHHILSLALKRK